MRLLSFLFGAMFSLSAAACTDHEVVVASENLPAKVTAYVSTNFPQSTITHATKELEGLGWEYKVWLNQGFVLEFNKKDNVVDIKGSTELPASVILQQIRDDVATRYPGCQIMEWELNERIATQDVKLSNGIELKYNMAGVFLGIDD